MKQAAIFDIESKNKTIANWLTPHRQIIAMMDGLNKTIWKDTQYDQSFHNKWDEVICIASKVLKKE